MKNSNRVFVLGCGGSSMHPEIMNFLKNEYVIAVSQWALLYEELQFDFYFINDNYRWRGKLRDKMQNFFTTDVPKWSKSLGQTDTKNEQNFFDSFKSKYTFGRHTYSAVPWSNKILDVDESLTVNGKLSVDNPESYFSDENFSKIKINRTGYGSVTRCAVDLAFFLRFKECYILNFDSIPLLGSAYNDYISRAFRQMPINEDNINNSKSYVNCGFSKPTWTRRKKVYNEYGMQVRRVITSEVNLYEQNFCNGNLQKIKKSVVDYFSPRRHFFETCLFENIMSGNTSPETNIEVKI